MKRFIWAIPPAVCLSLAAVSWGATGWKMTLGGATVSTSAKVIAGTTYVPIGDVARALGMRVSISGTNITLQPRATPVPTPVQPVKNPVKMSGLRGEMLFSREWGLQVVDVDRPVGFRTKYNNNINRDRNYFAKPSEDLIIVSCRLQNRTGGARNFAFPMGLHGLNTALVDQDGIAYPPAGYDVLAEEDTPFGKTVPAGAAVNFNMVFRVPNGARVKELVYSVVEYQALATGRSTDFRVDLVVP